MILSRLSRGRQQSNPSIPHIALACLGLGKYYCKAELLFSLPLYTLLTSIIINIRRKSYCICKLLLLGKIFPTSFLCKEKGKCIKCLSPLNVVSTISGRTVS